MSLRSLNIPVIDFVGKRKFAMIFSAILLDLSIASIGFQGLKFGIDFTGGTLIELGYEKTADLEDIRLKLAERVILKELMFNILVQIQKC